MIANSAQWMQHLASPDVAHVHTVVLVLLLIVAAAIDVRTMRIPNWLTVTGAVMGLALSAAIPWQVLGPRWALDGLLWGLGGMAVGLLLPLPLYALRVMGAGDVKLIAMVGTFVGLQQIVPTVLCVFITGGVVALVWAMYRRALRRVAANVRDAVSSMAFSVISATPLTGMAPGASLGKLPYGMSISVGTILYLASHQLGFL